MLSKQSAVAAITVVLLVVSVLPAGTAVAAPGDGTDCAFPLTATDGTGTEVTINETPDQVVVIGASAAQTTWEIGAQDAVVAIDNYATYLEGAGDLPTVAGFEGVDYEQALDLNPDLVIIDGNSYEDSVATSFRDANVTTYKLRDAGSLGGIINKTHTMGHLYGACEGAAETTTWMQERIDVVESATQGENAPSLFYDLGAAQDKPARYSAGNGTFSNSIITTAGASNIVLNGDFGMWPQVGNEFILEWLLVTYSPGFSSAAEAKQAVNDSDVLSQTAAAENGNVVAVNTNYLSQPAPRTIYPLQSLAKAVHPEAYAAANGTAEPTVTATATATATQTDAATATATETATATADGTSTQTAAATDTPTATDGGSSGGVPGFSVGVALVALAGAALIAGRRDQ